MTDCQVTQKKCFWRGDSTYSKATCLLVNHDLTCSYVLSSCAVGFRRIPATPWKFYGSPLKRALPKKEGLVFQPSFFRGELLNFGGVYFFTLDIQIPGSRCLHLETSPEKAFQGSKHLLTRYLEDFWCLEYGCFQKVMVNPNHPF